MRTLTVLLTSLLAATLAPVASAGPAGAADLLAEAAVVPHEAVMTLDEGQSCVLTDYDITVTPGPLWTSEHHWTAEVTITKPGSGSESPYYLDGSPGDYSATSSISVCPDEPGAYVIAAMVRYVQGSQEVSRTQVSATIEVTVRSRDPRVLPDLTKRTWRSGPKTWVVAAELTRNRKPWRDQRVLLQAKPRGVWVTVASRKTNRRGWVGWYFSPRLEGAYLMRFLVKETATTRQAIDRFTVYARW